MKSFNLKIALCFLICFAFLAGCTRSGLSYDFDVKEIKKKAKEVVIIINNKDSEALLEMSTTQLREGLTEKALEEIYEVINEGGEFDKFEGISVGGEIDKYSEEELAIVVVNTKYKNKNFAYTFIFNKQMELTVLYYKTLEEQ